MSEKLVMGYWDCAFCGEKKILGTQRACPCCGKVRGADAVFYMDDSKQYLNEEQAKTKGKGADWYCSYCDSLNSVMDTVCKSCGATKEESEANYFELQKKKEEAAAKKAAQKVEVQMKRQEVKPAKKKSILPLLLIPLLLVAAIVFMAMPKKADLKITDVYWQNTINIERYQQVEQSDWTLPAEAELVKTREEIQSYVQVLDHYDTETYTVEVPSGSHTEYSYKNNGDGTFSEVPYQVTDYTTETRTREVPVYRDEPVYATKYYYLIWVWLQERTVDTEGHDKNPVWGETNLAKDEREGERESYYTVTAEQKDKAKEYTVSEEIWKQIKVGDRIQCKVKGSTIIELQ